MHVSGGDGNITVLFDFVYFMKSCVASLYQQNIAYIPPSRLDLLRGGVVGDLYV